MSHRDAGPRSLGFSTPHRRMIAGSPQAEAFSPLTMRFFWPATFNGRSANRPLQLTSVPRTVGYSSTESSDPQPAVTRARQRAAARRRRRRMSLDADDGAGERTGDAGDVLD